MQSRHANVNLKSIQAPGGLAGVWSELCLWFGVASSCFTQAALAHAWPWPPPCEPAAQDSAARLRGDVLPAAGAQIASACVRAPSTAIGGINNLKNKINSCYQCHEASCPAQRWSLTLYLILEAETKCFNFILFST